MMAIVKLLVLAQELLIKCQKEQAIGTEPLMASCIQWCVTDLNEFDHTACRRSFRIKNRIHGTYNDSLTNTNVVPMVECAYDLHYVLAFTARTGEGDYSYAGNPQEYHAFRYRTARCLATCTNEHAESESTMDIVSGRRR